MKEECFSVVVVVNATGLFSCACGGLLLKDIP